MLSLQVPSDIPKGIYKHLEVDKDMTQPTDYVEALEIEQRLNKGRKP